MRTSWSLSSRRGPLAVALIALAAALPAGAGCSFDASFDGTRFQCGAGETCPGGFDCVNNICIAEPDPIDGGGDPIDADPAAPDADPAAPDATPAAADAAPTATICGSASLLQDDFDDGNTSPLWRTFVDFGASFDEVNGRFEVHIPANSDVWAGYLSGFAYDLTEGEIAVTVLRVGGFDTILEARGEGDVRVQVNAHDGKLRATVLNLPNVEVRAEITYDPVAHRHWRLRGAGGRLYWETSADRVTWAVLHDEAMPFGGRYVRPSIGAGGTDPTTSQAHFDDFNLPAPSVPGLCSASSLVDDFAGGGLAPSWAAWGSGGCTTTESNGRLSLSFPGSGESWCGIDSTHLFDFRDSAVSVEALPPAGANNFTTFFQLISADLRTVVNMERDPSGLNFLLKVDTTTISGDTIPFDAVDHRFWRVRENDGRIIWETSPDGTAWTNQHEATTARDLSGMLIELAAGHWSPGPGSPTISRFDQLNAP